MAFQLPQAIQLMRVHQINSLGWHGDWCDQWTDSQLYRASSCYAARWRYGQDDPENDPGQLLKVDGTPQMWPFPAEWWQPRNCVSDLARAGALLVAEVDRLGRAGLPWSHASERLTEVCHWGRLRGVWA